MLCVLGLRDIGEFDWPRIRHAQIISVNRYRILRIIVNLVLGLMVCQLYAETVPGLVLAGWLLALALSVSVPVGVLRHRMRMRPAPSLSDEHMSALVMTALTGLVWSVPLLIFIHGSDAIDLAALWTITASLVVATVFLSRALPLAAFVFNLIVMSAAVLAFLMIDEYVLIASIVMFAILLTMAGIESGRAFLMLNLSEAGLAEKNEVVSLLLREFEEGAADWLWQVDKSRRVINPSPRFAYALGREKADIVGVPLVQLISGAAWETGTFPASLHELAEKLKHKQSFSNLVVKVSIEGETCWWELSASPTYDDRGAFTGFRGVGSDVTESRKTSEKIARMARFDNLTGLPNRLQLTEAADAALQEAAKWRSYCGFLMIDLDRFKSVNDTLGHLVGDRLLAQVSRRLRSIMTSNEVCGRLGGDEFAVVMREMPDEQELAAMANRIIASLSRPYEVDEHTLYIGASIGSAVGPRDGENVETLMRSADLALYRSKDEGGGRHYHYEPQLHLSAEERRVMEMALRKALEKDEFELHYQPVVAADTEGVIGFEALLRWHNPKFGQVSPAKFIPIAEEARLVVPIGNWVLHTACKEATTWPGNIKVAVNVSAEQLFEPDFVETVVEALSESGLSPHRLELEVTESVFLREGSTAATTLEEILQLGVGLALDDFGTGYSALGYLGKTRFTTIKVDRSFVQGAAKGMPESLAIIRAVVAMADSLGMATTAEGVETAHEVEMIRQLGCSKLQGYYYGRPMCIDDVHGLFAEARSVKIA